ncbi:hypothetical protein I4U23_025167 [Adineta vaga]|nr:hypothetical protein I4U23_025167 [Adineta vaga]
MSEKGIEKQHSSTDITVAPTNASATTNPAKVSAVKTTVPPKKKKNVMQSLGNFIYNPRQKTVLGRSSLNWAKLALFYSIFFLCLGSFFVGLLYLFALFTDSNEPRYTNAESTMAVRTTATVVGLGFRPQPNVNDNLIRVTNDPEQQKQIASSLGLYRQIYLTQNNEAKTEVCSADNPSHELPLGVACEFDWSDIVKTEDHPCSARNLYGFKQEQPCVLVKLNKVYGWTPTAGHLPKEIINLQGINHDRVVTNPDVYITCEGSVC